MGRGQCTRVPAVCHTAAVKIISREQRVARFSLKVLALAGFILVVGPSVGLAAAAEAWPSII
jgi:hypothetical protein